MRCISNKGLDAFGVGFVGALGGEDLHHRLDDRDVRAFEHAEGDRRRVGAAGDDRAFGSGAGRRGEDGAAERAQVLGSGERR
jgi:hypothetical protein